MNKLTDFKHLKQGDELIHFEHGWVSQFKFLTMSPDNPDIAIIIDFWGNPVTLHVSELDEISSEWFEKCTEIQIARYRKEYYENMAEHFRRKYQLFKK